MLSAEWLEERSQVLDQQFGFLQRGEVAASWHLRPALNVQVALGKFARKVDPWGEIFGEAGEPRWNVTESMARYLMTLNLPFVIHNPPELREALLRLGERMVQIATAQLPSERP